MGLESTLLVTSGWHAVMAFTSAFVKKDDVVLRFLNHACLIDAIRSSGATKRIYQHLDLNDLKRQVANVRKWHRGRIWLYTESYFSMDADLAPLHNLLEIAEEFDLQLFVDHAHATGIFSGLSTRASWGTSSAVAKLWGRPVPFWVCTEPAANGSSTKAVLLCLRRAFPPLIAGALLGALKLLQQEPQRQNKYWTTPLTCGNS